MLESLKKAIHTQVDRVNDQWVEIRELQGTLDMYGNLKPGDTIPLACMLSSVTLHLPQDAVYELVVKRRNKQIDNFMRTFLKFQRTCLSFDTEMPVEHTQETLYAAIAEELGVTLPARVPVDIDG